MNMYIYRYMYIYIYMCVCNSRVRQRVSLDAVAPSGEAIAALAARRPHRAANPRVVITASW